MIKTVYFFSNSVYFLKLLNSFKNPGKRCFGIPLAWPMEMGYLKLILL